MSKLTPILILVLLCAKAFAQNVEVARFEMPLTAKSQQSGFVILDHEIMAFAERNSTQTKGAKELDLFILDSNLVAQKSFSTSLDANLQLSSSTASDEFAAAVFASTKRTDSTKVNVVLYDRMNGKFSSFATTLPPNITLVPSVAASHTLMIAYNHNNGGSSITFFDMRDGTTRRETLQDNDFLIRNTEVLPTTDHFIVTLKRFENRHSVATDFMHFTSEGTLVNSYSYPNGENTTIGRSCCKTGSDGSLRIFATLELINNTKVSAKGFADNYDNETIGIVWISFTSGHTQSKTYLFKDIPDIDKALTPSHRLRVKQRQVQQNDSTAKRVEIAFQLLKPNLLLHNDTCIMALEAFIPIYHTETRMEFGYYGSVPTTYTVFDGYDFYSHLLFAFSDKGELLWHSHTKFDNPTDENLTRHTSEAISHNEIVTLSTSYNTLIYSVTDLSGTKLLDEDKVALPMMRQNDILASEASSYIRQWYGNNFIVFGKQTVKNRMMRKAERLVSFLQKIQYE